MEALRERLRDRPHPPNVIDATTTEITDTLLLLFRISQYKPEEAGRFCAEVAKRLQWRP